MWVRILLPLLLYAFERSTKKDGNFFLDCKIILHVTKETLLRISREKKELIKHIDLQLLVLICVKRYQFNFVKLSSSKTKDKV